MPEPILDREDPAYHGFLCFAANLARSQGIIVNTFDSLEPRAIKAITDGFCIPDSKTPLLYNIGPFIDKSFDRTGGEAECFSWLDAQPNQSVVFLSFGSQDTFSALQVREIATGLDNSGQRFLWVVRSPPPKQEHRNNKRLAALTDPDLDALLPEGFLARTRNRGLVVKSWAPQEAVLNRESVGGFVTQCGWNSILEAVCAGVPMVAWPLCAEQHMNRAVLVEDMKLAMPVEQAEDGFVSSVEVEMRVRALMESEEGRALRERSQMMRENAKAVHGQGGSSRIAFYKLTESWRR
nr:TPA_asm: hypothetical protein HUJ06_013406 [Nelumbo nucifera]